MSLASRFIPMSDARSAIDRAKARLDRAQRELRSEELFGVSHQSRLFELERAVANAERELAAAQAAVARSMT